MPEIQALRGWRYNLAHVGRLSDVVAPPYDVIDADLQAALYKRHPCNVIRLILNRQEPGDDGQTNRYTRAARFLRQWKHEGVLMEEGEPAVYVCHQAFAMEGRRHVRKGFMARVKLERWDLGGTGEPSADARVGNPPVAPPQSGGSGSLPASPRPERPMIFPHEETMPGPKADRLQLMEATGMNLSPIFALYPDPEGEVQASLEEAIAGQIPIEAADHLGVASRLWPVSGQRAVSRVAGLMGPRPLFVADGHHRYETALAYRDRLTAAGKLRGDTDPANFMLMMLVRISDPGLVILPTHRLVSGLPGLRAEQLREQLGPDFQWEDVGTGPESAEAAWEMMQADGAQELLGFGTAADGHWQLARLGSADAMEALAPAHSPAWRSLGVSILHELVLGRCLAPRFATPPTIRYVHSIDEVQLATAHSTLRTQDSGLSTDLACLVQRAMLEHLQQIASGLEKMPAKSTYFYPKLLSGLVFNPLR